MNVDIIKGIIKILQSEKNTKLAKLLEKSYGEISESDSYGSLLYSLLSTLEIHSPLSNHIELSKLTSEEKEEILKAAKVIVPPKAHSPEIVSLAFFPTLENEKSDSYSELIGSLDLSKFWSGFTALTNEFLYSKGYFKDFSKGANREEFIIDESLVNSKMRQAIGEALFPFQKQPSNSTIIELIKFFFKFAMTPDWERGKATYEYTVGVNNLFNNFGIPLTLKKGNIIGKKSLVLDRIFELDRVNIIKKDPTLTKILNEAIENFTKNIDTALEKIANALERVKTFQNPNNKSSSMDGTIKSITIDENIQNLLTEHTKNLTKISNQYAIRHKEKNQKELESEALKQYYFYEYFNLIRLILDAIDKEDRPYSSDFSF